MNEAGVRRRRARVDPPHLGMPKPDHGDNENCWLSKDLPPVLMPVNERAGALALNAGQLSSFMRSLILSLAVVVPFQAPAAASVGSAREEAVVLTPKSLPGPRING